MYSVACKHTENNNNLYLLVTIICENKILRFGDSDDFASIKLLRFHEVELNFAISCNQRLTLLTLKSTGLANVAVSRLKLLQCKYMIVVFVSIYIKHATWCSVHPLSGKNKVLISFARETPTIIDIIKRHFLELVMAQKGRKERQKETDYACSKKKKWETSRSL